MDYGLGSQLPRWSRRRHPGKAAGWVARRYWHKEDNLRLVFGRRGLARLRYHDEMPIARHLKVRTDASIYDGNLLYWASRLGRHPELPASRANLLKLQKGRCAWCGLFFTTMDDVMEVDHKVPRSRGGTDLPHNRQLLHGHCHYQKSTRDHILS